MSATRASRLADLVAAYRAAADAIHRIINAEGSSPMNGQSKALAAARHKRDGAAVSVADALVIGKLVAVRDQLTEEDAKRAAVLLSAQWPKRCGCGKEYKGPTLGTMWWNDLRLAYVRTDAFSTNEARHCWCGSTLEIMLAVHDPDELTK